MDNVKRETGKLEFFWEKFLYWGTFEAGGLDLENGVETFTHRDTNITRYPSSSSRV